MIIFKLRDMTIRQKLTAIIMLTCAAALCMAIAIFVTWKYYNAREKLVANMLTHAAIIADNSKAAIAFKNKGDAKEILSALHAENNSVFACLYDIKGQVLAKYQRWDISQDIQPPRPQKDGYAFEKDCLSLFRRIELDNETIGTIYLRADLNEIYQDLTRTLITGIIIALGVLFVAYLASSQLQKIISKPILNLAETAKNVSEKKDYSTRAVKSSNDEVGWLTIAFNKMLEQIQQRDLELVNVNEQLETKVQQRTSELTKEIAVRKKAERALKDLNMELEVMVDKLTVANRELGDFAHIAAHDLKAPLRAIGSLAGMVAADYADRLDEQGRQYLALLVARTERMGELIAGILRYSELGRAVDIKQQVVLNEVVDEAIAEVAPPENIKIIKENDFPVITCDRTHMIQLLQNLISNAVKYMDKPAGEIRIGCTEEDGFWKFSVADNGCGIDERHFEKIFQIFQTLTRRDELESTGIGLSLVRKIVEIYDGRIWVESTPGEGSTFFFTLPKRKVGVENEKLQTNIVG